MYINIIYYIYIRNVFNDYRKHTIIVEVSRVGINRNGGYMSFNDLDKIVYLQYLNHIYIKI